jgi:hypothetical protein
VYFFFLTFVTRSVCVRTRARSQVFFSVGRTGLFVDGLLFRAGNCFFRRFKQRWVLRRVFEVFFSPDEFNLADAAGIYTPVSGLPFQIFVLKMPDAL